MVFLFRSSLLFQISYLLNAWNRKNEIQWKTSAIIDHWEKERELWFLWIGLMSEPERVVHLTHFYRIWLWSMLRNVRTRCDPTVNPQTDLWTIHFFFFFFSFNFLLFGVSVAYTYRRYEKQIDRYKLQAQADAQRLKTL